MIKTFTIAIITLFFYSLPVMAQDSTTVTKIYFIRNTGYNGAAINFHCFIDSQLVCNLKNKKFSIHDTNAGSHTINVRYSGKNVTSEINALTIVTEPGKNYYIKILPGKTYSTTVTLKLMEVTESTAKSLLAKCTEQTDCL